MFWAENISWVTLPCVDVLCVSVSRFYVEFVLCKTCAHCNNNNDLSCTLSWLLFITVLYTGLVRCCGLAIAIFVVLASLLCDTGICDICT